MYELLLIIGIVFGILQIILFFKIWGMTNNVAELTRILKELLEKQKDQTMNITEKGDIKIGDLVIELKSERQMRVSAITNEGKYECKIGGITSAGTFDRNEIESFDNYYKK